MLSEEIKEKLTLIRDIPFAFNEARSIDKIIETGHGSCSGKHELARRLLQRYGIDSHFVHVSFQMKFELLKFGTFSSYFIKDNLYPHTFLEVTNKVAGIYIDITFDRYISTFAPVNESIIQDNITIGPFKKKITTEKLTSQRRALLELPANDQDPQWKQAELQQLNSKLAQIRAPFQAKILSQKQSLLKMIDEYELD